MIPLGSVSENHQVVSVGFSITGQPTALPAILAMSYDWVEIPPGKERVLIGDGNAMRVTGAGSLNFKMH